ncbi:MAG: UDP-glucose 4-epimerase [Planctomycetes bacterium ADurb.Bin126]|nr:MAG: UDP-glucose 4-epimerase [Planctomycetes bacterium ADurb.Bin126]HOD84063.1 SDR family oxidoreductase [Phycisphaerae bacterium]HQL76091.1 SDR family oxidoreductase [Phycisphaerae bacterium]
MARYLVTGGAGFIGCNLVRFLLDRGHEAVVLDNFSTGKRANLAAVADRIRLVEGDVRDRAAVDACVEGCQAVFHEAALGSVPRSVAEPILSHDVNVNGTLTVLEAARAAGVRRVVFAASSSAYGEQADSPKHEQMAPAPISPYASGKVACEMYMRAYAAVYGMQTLCLRYFNVFGPHQDPTGAYAAVIPAFVARLLANQPPVVYGDGEQSRDFCYIDNVCQANYLAATAPDEVCDGRAVNIACNQATTLNEILALLGELLGTKVRAVYEPARPGDVKHSLASIDAARQAIGYEPKVFFREGLTRAIDWYRENL